jgi:hypothetical protein
MRLNGDDLVAIGESPGFRSLHESLMVDELLGCLGGTMRFNIVSVPLVHIEGEARRGAARQAKPSQAKKSWENPRESQTTTWLGS